MAQFVTGLEFEQKPIERASGPRGKRARTAEQAEWDEAILAAYEEGHAFAVQIHPDEAPEIRKKVTSSCNYLDLGKTEGLARPGSDEGTVILHWKIREIVKRGPRGNTSAE